MPTSSSSGSGTRELELDLRGEVCPYTFVRARLALEELAIGARLRVVVDHEPATKNIPKSAEAWGQVVETVEARGDGTFSITLVKRVR